MDGDHAFGNTWIHLAISLVMKGFQYNPHELSEVTIDKISFVFHMASLE
jgi:hypothetical protein